MSEKGRGKMKRKGEKIGWAAGWMGGVIWVIILSMIFLVQGRWLIAVLGLLIVVAAALAILLCAPWRYPNTPYWKLMLGPYAVFFISVAWAVWAYGGIYGLGLNWWNFLWLLPVLIPFGTLSKRKWSDFDGK